MNSKSIIKYFSFASVILLAQKSHLDTNIINNIKNTIIESHESLLRPFIYGSSISTYAILGLTLIAMISAYISKTEKNKMRFRQ